MNSQTLQNEKLFLFTLAGMMFTHILDFMIMIPLGPQLMRLLQVSTHDFGLLLSCYTFAAAASSFLAANFIDRFDHRKTFLTLYFLFSLATLACALAQSFVWLLLARTLAGMFGGLIEAMVHTMLATNIPFARRGAATGKIYAAFSLSTVIGVPSGLYLANLLPELNWHAPFLLLSGICGLFFFLALSQLPRTASQLQPQAQRVNHFLLVLQNPHLRLALLFVALASCGGFLVMPYVPLYLTSNVNVAESFIPTIYLCAGVATLFSSPQIGKFADRYGKPRIFSWLVGPADWFVDAAIAKNSIGIWPTRSRLIAEVPKCGQKIVYPLGQMTFLGFTQTAPNAAVRLDGTICVSPLIFNLLGSKLTAC